MNQHQLSSIIFSIYLIVFILPIIYTSWYIGVNGYTGHLNKLKIDNINDVVYLLVVPLMFWPVVVVCYLFYLVMSIPHHLAKLISTTPKREYIDD